MDTPRPPALHPLLVLFGALAAVEFRGGAGPWASGTSRTQQGGRRQEFFNHPASLPLFCLSFCLVVLPSIAHCLESSFASFYILQFKMQGSYGGTSAYMQYTHRQVCRHESETIKSTEAAETAGGGLWPHCTTGCRIIELDMSDRSVSGTKCTDEFLAALTMALIYRLFWSPLLCFIAQ